MRSTKSHFRSQVMSTAVGLVATLAGSSTLCAQAGSAVAGFTSAQANQGKVAYARNCASCHGQNLDDGPFGPPLKGAAFLQKFGGKSAAGLFTVVSTKMPPDSPGSLGAPAYAELLAFLLESNAARPGAQ